MALSLPGACVWAVSLSADASSAQAEVRQEEPESEPGPETDEEKKFTEGADSSRQNKLLEEKAEPLPSREISISMAAKSRQAVLKRKAVVQHVKVHRTFVVVQIVARIADEVRVGIRNGQVELVIEALV